MNREQAEREKTENMVGVSGAYVDIPREASRLWHPSTDRSLKGHFIVLVATACSLK